MTMRPFLRAATSTLLLVVLRLPAGAADGVPTYVMSDEGGFALWGKCPANVRLERPLEIDGPEACPEGYRTLGTGTLVTDGTGTATRCWNGPVPEGLVPGGPCTLCMGAAPAPDCPYGDRPTLSFGRLALNECAKPLFTQTTALRPGLAGMVTLTGSSIVHYGSTSCPTRQPLDAAQLTIPAPYRIAPYRLVYSGKVYRGLGSAIATQCWASPPAVAAATPVGDCAVCQ